jgi:hypothetical protein
VHAGRRPVHVEHSGFDVDNQRPAAVLVLAFAGGRLIHFQNLNAKLLGRFPLHSVVVTPWQFGPHVVRNSENYANRGCRPNHEGSGAYRKSLHRQLLSRSHLVASIWVTALGGRAPQHRAAASRLRGRAAGRMLANLAERED